MITEKLFEMERQEHFNELKNWYGEFFTEYNPIHVDEHKSLYLVKLEKQDKYDMEMVELVRVFDLAGKQALSVDDRLEYNFENMCRLMRVAKEKMD